MQSNTNPNTGKITGHVFDQVGPEGQQVKNPVAGAKIEVFSVDPREVKDATAVLPPQFSDADGRFAIDNVPPGNYWVRCDAFLPAPLVQPANVQPGSCVHLLFDVGLDFGIATLAAVGDCQPVIPCDRVTEGRIITLRADHTGPIKPVTFHWRADGGRLEPHFADNSNERHLRTDGARGKIDIVSTMHDANGAHLSTNTHVFVNEAVAQLIRGNIGVTKKRTDVPPTDDLGFWGAIRNRAKALSFGGVGIKGGKGRGYQGFIDAVLCAGMQELGGPICPQPFNLGGLASTSRNLPMHGMAAYELLKAATEIFLLWNCGVAITRHDTVGARIVSEREEFSRIGLSVHEITEALSRYLGAGRLPYIERVVQTAFPGELPSDSVFCTGVLTRRVDCPCMIELIWSYWHEEGMLVQGMNTISRRFQNVRAPGDRDPLVHLEIDPLRPLNNLLWGYVQDEQNRLTVKRRAYEYDHHYGLTIYGRAMGAMRPADSRSKFIEGFHNLLHAAAVFYKEDNDTNYIADGFPLLNALKEVHLQLAQGAGNQCGDLPWTARSEMLIQQWLIARPEMRDFLQSRAMVPYTEAWMPQVDTMKALQGWSDVTITHFHDLATYGELLLLSIRYGDWIDLNDENHAKNWARYWRPEIQGYLHAYRAVTGVDLSNPDTVDYTMPAVHLQKRLASQRAR